LTIRSVWSTVAAVYDRRYSRVSDIEEVLRNSDDVLQVEKPPQHHFDRQCCHCQQKERHHVEPNRPECLVKTLEPLLREQWWNQKEIAQYDDKSEHLTDERVLG